MNAIVFYRMERWLYLHHMEFIAKGIRALIFLLFNSYIPYTCEIGKGTKFGYKGIGCVIHGRAKIGQNCVIAPGVTIGGRSAKYDVPVIGDNVYMAGGCKVLGPIKIGNNVIIGANAVMLSDAPDNSVWGGGTRKVYKRKCK